MSARAATTVREGQTFDGSFLLARYASLVKLPHTLFALPFAGLGAVLATYSPGVRITPVQILWITLAFTAARFAAMAFNRIVDREYDAANPRTRQRELPTGRITLAQARLSVVVASIVFLGAAFMLNTLCGLLSPIALAWIFFYSYTKRFTPFAHSVLGLSLGIAPAGGYLAVAGTWSTPAIALVVLAAAVMFWVAGFDIIYSIQDIEFDRRVGLHSIAARYGAATATRIARAFHALAVLLFLALYVFRLFPVGRWYLAGVIAAALLLVYENWSVRDAARTGLDMRTVDRAFFHTNVGVSMGLFAFTLIDRLLAG